MPAEILDSNGLAWKATVDYSQIPDDIKAIQKLLSVDVDILNTEGVSADLSKIRAELASSMKLIAETEARTRQEVARILMESDNQVAANRSNIEEDWKAQIQEQIRVLTEYQQQLTSVGNVQPGKAPVSTQKIGLDPESVGIIQQAKDMFAQLDQETADVVASLLELNVEYERIQATMEGLNDQMKAGKIDSVEYAKAVASLAKEERDVADTIDMIVQQQKDLDAIRRMENGSIIQKKAILEQLEKQYESLSQTERSTTTGDQLYKQIQSLSAEIKGLSPKALTEVKEKTITAAQELRKLKQLMATDPGSPMFEEWKTRAGELQESMEEVRNTIKLTTSDSAGVDALAEGVRGLVGGFTAVTGAIGFFAEGNEEAEKAIQKTMGALAVLNGVQEISRVLEKESALNIYLTSLMRKRDAVATAVQTAATTTQATATTAATTATRSLTAAMMANPATALVVGITALVGAYLLFRKRSDEVKTSQELLAEATKEVSNSYQEQQAKILPYLAALKDGNLTENQRLDIYEKLKEINPSIVEGINAKTLSYDALTNNVRNYLTELKNQMKLESNSKAIQESLGIELSLDEQIEKQRQIVELKRQENEESKKVRINVGGNMSGTSGNTRDRTAEFTAAKEELDRLEQAKVKQQKVTEDLANASASLTKKQGDQNAEVKRTVEVIDREIAEKKKLQSQNAVNSKEWLQYQTQINALEKERELITGKKEKSTRSNNKAENELNSILDKRKSILESIAGLERDADQSGMLKKASELDKINEKYDQQIVSLQKVNEEIQRFNQKNPKNKQSLLGDSEITRINAARETELQNTRYREDAQAYIDSLKNKRLAFDVFLQAQESGNSQITELAREQYSDQLGNFSSYISFLQSEIGKLVGKGLTSKLNIGDALRLQELNKEYLDAVQERENKNKEITRETLAEILRNTESFADQRVALEKKQQKEIEILEKNYQGSDLQKRKQALKSVHDQEIKDLNDYAFRLSEAYKLINQQIQGFSFNALQGRLQQLKEVLKKDKTLTAEQIAEVQQAIQEARSMIEQKMVNGIRLVSGVFQELSTGLKGINDELSEMLSGMASIGSIAESSLSATSAFLSGDLSGGITGTVQALGQIFANIAAKKQSEKVAQQAVLDFQTRILLGEYEMNAILMQRERDQAKLNKLKIDGLKAEKEILEDQQNITQKTYDDLFKKLQQEQFVSGQGTKKKNNWGAALLGGALGSLGTSRTEVVDQMASLMGKSFDDIEKLYLQGRLSPKALELFEQLKKIKQEGVDIDALLQQNAESLREIFTGTTSDSILDSIADGFRNGLRSAADFADTFEQLMQNAVINALKYQVLEEPLKEFYAQFAADAQSDDILTEAEIQQLKKNFDGIIGNAGRKFEELQKITNVNFDAVNSTRGQGLQGSIKGITEQQAELLAGQFGGLRMTALDALKVANQQLSVMNDIRYNTSFLENMNALSAQLTSAVKDIHLNGLKVK